MTIQDFKNHPQRVWINNPSTLQPFHELHGTVGIGVYKKHTTGHEEVSIYFTEGNIYSMNIDPIHLDKKS